MLYGDFLRNPLRWENCAKTCLLTCVPCVLCLAVRVRGFSFLLEHSDAPLFLFAFIRKAPGLWLRAKSNAQP